MKWYKQLMAMFLVASGIMNASNTPVFTLPDVHDSCDTESTSKSYMNFQPAFQVGSPEYIAGFRHNGLSEAEECWGLQIVVFGGRTTKSSHLGRYFGPFGIDMSEDMPLRFGVDPQRTTGNFDLLASHFGILTSNEITLDGPQFLSSVTMKPRQSFAGVGFQFRYNFWHNYDRERGWWFSISAPVEHVTNAMHFNENIINKGGDPVTSGEVIGGLTIPNQQFFNNMTAAFEQSAWNFGKIKTSGSLKKTRVADLDIRIGYEWLQLTPYHLESFFGIIVPTGNKPHAHYLFEPIIGNGGHFAVEWGATYEIDVWDNECREMYVSLELSAVGKYLFKRKQTRMLDLKYKPWSRYIQLYANQAAAQAAETSGNSFSFTPGINVLTQEVDVTPGYQAFANTAFILDWKRFNFEAGYNLFVRRAECVELANNFTTTAAIKDFAGGGFTSPIRDVRGNPYTENAIQTAPPFQLPVTVANYAQSIIKESDLDLNSSNTPATLAHTIYGNFAFDFECREWPLFIDAGASYTFSHVDNVVEKWMVWGKIGVIF